MTVFVDVFYRVAPNHGFSVPLEGDLNATYVAIRDCICDFKAETKLSWAVIMPAAQIASVSLFIRSHGVATTRKLFELMVEDIRSNDSKRQHIYDENDTTFLKMPDEHVPLLIRFNATLWRTVTDLIARKHPADRIAIALSAFASTVACNSVHPLYAAKLIAKVNAQLQAGRFNQLLPQTC